MKDGLFSYDDMYLVPKHSSLKSRTDADISVDLHGRKFASPVIPANMLDVISFSNAKFLAERGYFYIMHRFEEATRKFAQFAYDNQLPLVSISVGVNNDSKLDLEYAMKYGPIHWICIDTAHGDHDNVGGMIKHIQKEYGTTAVKIIAGNVATADGYRYLVDCGVNVVKVSIGSGSICTTRYETGFHLPTAYSVWECAQTGLDVPIIADGGIKHRGDIAKALVLGASLVMCGGLFAQCVDSPAKIVHGRKVYRGSTSYEAKGNGRHVEGRTIEMDEGITYEEQLDKIHDSLTSAISYAGGTNISAFNHVEWKLL